MKISKKTSRHPAVVDLLGGAPTTPAGGTTPPAGPAGPVSITAPPAAPSPGGENPSPRRPGPKVLIGCGVAAAAIIGGTIWGTSLGSSGDPANTAITVTTTDPDDGTLPILDLPEATTTTTASPEVDDECRADRGDQKSGAGVIAAWNHAYYVQRSGAAARALATPNSSVVPADQLQPFIDDIPVGTNYCVRTKALSDDVYLVDLSEMRPEGVQRITQTVTTKKIDGKWFVDVFN